MKRAICFAVAWMAAGVVATTAEPDAVPVTAVEVTVEEVEGTTWAWHSGGKLHLAAKGVASHTRWKETGKWKVQKDGTVQLSGNGTRFVIEFLSESTARVECRKGGSTTLKKLERE